MNDLSPNARAALRALTQEQALGVQSRDALLQRVHASIEAGDADPGGPTDELMSEPADRAAPPLWMWAVAAAAAVLLGVWGIEAITSQTAEPGTRAQPAVAPYEAVREPADGEALPARPAAPPATVPQPRPEPPPEIQAQPEPEPPPQLDPRRTSKPSPKPPARSKPRPQTGLAQEMALMRRAQAALDSDEPRRALVVLGEHARTFADGQLAEDRRALRIVALCEAGRLADARREASAFHRDFARSHYQLKINACLERSSSDGDGSQ